MRNLALWNATLPATEGILPSQLRVEAGGFLKLSQVTIQLDDCADLTVIREAYCGLDGGPPPHVEVGVHAGHTWGVGLWRLVKTVAGDACVLQ